jgi:hypothetical protein
MITLQQLRTSEPRCRKLIGREQIDSFIPADQNKNFRSSDTPRKCLIRIEGCARRRTDRSGGGTQAQDATSRIVRISL